MQMESVGRCRVNVPEYREWTAGPGGWVWEDLPFSSFLLRFKSCPAVGQAWPVPAAPRTPSTCGYSWRGYLRRYLPLGALFIPLLLGSHTWTKGSESLSPCGEANTFLCNSLWWTALWDYLPAHCPLPAAPPGSVCLGHCWESPQLGPAQAHLPFKNNLHMMLLPHEIFWKVLQTKISSRWCQHRE